LRLGLARKRAWLLHGRGRDIMTRPKPPGCASVW
jgi:hypothetical protein